MVATSKRWEQANSGILQAVAAVKRWQQAIAASKRWQKASDDNKETIAAWELWQQEWGLWKQVVAVSKL